MINPLIVYFTCVRKFGTKQFIQFQKIEHQARNQARKAGEFTLNLGTTINIHLQQEKERPRREKICGFFT